MNRLKMLASGCEDKCHGLEKVFELAKTFYVVVSLARWTYGTQKNNRCYYQVVEEMLVFLRPLRCQTLVLEQ